LPPVQEFQNIVAAVKERSLELHLCIRIVHRKNTIEQIS